MPNAASRFRSFLEKHNVSRVKNTRWVPLSRSTWQVVALPLTVGLEMVGVLIDLLCARATALVCHRQGFSALRRLPTTLCERPVFFRLRAPF
jgi:hypothetical protein